MGSQLGAKNDIYTGSRCMASGILLGRMAAGLVSFGRGLENKKSWSPTYAVHFGAEGAYKASEQIEKLQTTARPQIKSFRAKIEAYKDYGSSSGFNREKASLDLEAAKSDLSSIAQIVAKTCGKRRPAEGEGEALVQMKTVKREKSAPKDVPMVLPDFITVEPPPESSSSLPLILGVLTIIAAAFLVR